MLLLCPLCSEPPKPSPEEETAPEKIHPKDALKHEKISKSEVYKSLMEDVEAEAEAMGLDLEKEEKLEIHKKVLESEEIQKTEKKRKNDV